MTVAQKPETVRRSDFICENIGLARVCANRFRGKGIDYDDLFQAGCLGLIKAADGFDPDRGLRFSTYAVPVILGEIKCLFREGGAVKVSRSLRELSLRATREREAFARDAGREPTVEELALCLGVEPTQAAQALCAGLPPVSLTVSEEGEETFDLPIASPEEPITDRLAVRQLLAALPPRDRALICLRYQRRMTQQATADALGMTQVQVSRRERALLLEMRQKLTE